MSEYANPRLRARDLDRNAAIEILDQAYADGQLNYSEHAERTAALRAAKTLGELQSALGDLQRSSMPMPLTSGAPQSRRFNRRFLVGFIAFDIIAVIVIFAVFFRGDDSKPAESQPLTSHPSSAVATPSGEVTPIVAPRLDFSTAAGIGQFFDLYRARFGDGQTIEMGIYPDGGYALVTRAENDGFARYDFRGGFQRDEISFNRPEQQPFDIAAIDLNKLAGVMVGAGESVGIAKAKISNIQISSPVDAGGAGQIGMSVGDSTGRRSGYLTMTFAGEIIRVSPTT